MLSLFILIQRRKRGLHQIIIHHHSLTFGHLFFYFILCKPKSYKRMNENKRSDECAVAWWWAYVREPKMASVFLSFARPWRPSEAVANKCRKTTARQGSQHYESSRYSTHVGIRVLKANVSVSASSKMTAFGWRSLTLTLSNTLLPTCY